MHPTHYAPTVKNSTNAKELWEKSYAADFLRSCGIPFTDLQSVSEFRKKQDVAGPDAKATIATEAGRMRVGIELALYSSDASVKKGSIYLRRVKIRECLRHQLATFLDTYPDLDRFQIQTFFRLGEESMRKNDCARIAMEIADLIGPQLLSVRHGRTFSPADQSTVFEKYPTLAKLTTGINIFRTFGNVRGTFGWFNGASDDGRLGIQSEQLSHIIDQHQVSKYDVSDVEECWLVVYSTGHGSFVWTQEMEEPTLVKPSVTSAATRSGFHRVYFWCQEFKWSVLLGVDSASLRVT